MVSTVFGTHSDQGVTEASLTASQRARVRPPLVAPDLVVELVDTPASKAGALKACGFKSRQESGALAISNANAAMA